MKIVKIKTGVYGYRMESGRVIPVGKGERVALPDEEAARLVALDVAAYMDAAAQDPVLSPAMAAGGEAPLGQPTDTPGGEAPSEAATGSAEGASADAEVTRLERMPKADLERMAQDMGVDISGTRNKHDLAVLIVAADADNDDEALPGLGAGDIVT